MTSAPLLECLQPWSHLTNSPCSLFPAHFAVPGFPMSLQAMRLSQVISYSLPIHSEATAHPTACVNPALPSALGRGMVIAHKASPQPHPQIQALEAQGKHSLQRW